MRSMYAAAALAAIGLTTTGSALAYNGYGSAPPPEEAEPASTYDQSYPQLAGGPSLPAGDRWRDKGDYGDQAYSPPPPPEEDYAPYAEGPPPEDQAYAEGPEAGMPSGPAHHYAPPPEQYAQGPDQSGGYADEGHAEQGHGHAEAAPAQGGWRRYEFKHKGPAIRGHGRVHGRKTVKTYTYDSGWVPTHRESHAYGSMSHGQDRHAYGLEQGYSGGQAEAPPPMPESGYGEHAQGYGQEGGQQGYGGEGYDRYGGGYGEGEGGYAEGGYGEEGYGGAQSGGEYHSFWKYRTGYRPACGAHVARDACGGYAGLRLSNGFFADSGGVGPAWVASGGGGGGFVVAGSGAFARASASASARARVHVSGGGKGGHHGGGGCCK